VFFRFRVTFCPKVRESFPIAGFRERLRFRSFASPISFQSIINAFVCFSDQSFQASLSSNASSTVHPRLKRVVSCPKCVLFQAPIRECSPSPTFCTQSSVVHPQLLPEACSHGNLPRSAQRDQGHRGQGWATRYRHLFCLLLGTDY
jgi:hypothetical protein